MPAAVRLTCAAILNEKKTIVNIILVNKVQKRYNTTCCYGEKCTFTHVEGESYL